MPDSKPVAGPRRQGEMQLTDGRSAPPAPTSAATRSSASSTLVRIDAGAPVGGGRIICAIAAPDGTEVAQSSGGLRATYPRSSEAGSTTRKCRKRCWSTSAPTAPNSRVLEHRRPARRASPPSRASSSNGPTYQVGRERLEYFLPAGKPKQDLELPFYTIWRSDESPAAKVACTLTTQRRQNDGRDRGRAAEDSPPIDEEAEELKQEEREEAEAEEAADRRAPLAARPAAPGPPPSLCRPCSASGWRARLPSGGGQRRAHRDRVLGARGRGAARRPRPRGWAGSPASGRGPWRPPRSASW